MTPPLNYIGGRLEPFNKETLFPLNDSRAKKVVKEEIDQGLIALDNCQEIRKRCFGGRRFNR